MRFIKATPALEKAFKKRDWPTVAFFYNGSGYAKNKYDVKLGQHYDLYQMPGRLPDIEIRAAQARLTYLGFDPRGVDGAAGQGTAVAVISFQKAKGLAPTGDVNDVKAALIEAAGV
jgi:hypothetical protein